MYNEFSFWGNIDYATNEEAKLQRDRKARELQSAGHKIRKSMLTGQMRKYASLGVPDGRVGHVYYVRVVD